ncbi:putative DNA-3-methyladenine glycosylase [Streptococcus acidominimus]|nr:putative DNA-3-methyladenine glycosylase [Streptococcus acidominimus]
MMKTDTVETAKALLGMDLYLDEQLLGRIVEVEAYLGSEDSACHSARGRRSKKNASMYLAAGHWYVYQMYGYALLNLVTKPENEAEAVLIRALQMPDGQILGNGPGKMTRQTGISMQFDGDYMPNSRLQVKPGAMPCNIAARPRIGITCQDEWKLAPLCFYVAHNHHVSKISKKGLLEDWETWLLD